MPVKSQAQYELMKKIRDGELPDGYRGISRQLAEEFLSDTPDSLPSKAPNKGLSAMEKELKKQTKLFKKNYRGR